MSGKTGRINSLTGIRGVAACWVVSLHALDLVTRLTGTPSNAYPVILTKGYLAVDLFFLLSGYILAANYFPKFIIDPVLSVRQFALGRLFRIMPLNSFALLVFAVVTALTGPQYLTTAKLTLGSFMASLFLVQSWGFSAPDAWNYPAWSLSTEWLAYFGFPIGLFIFSRVQRPALSLIGGFISLLALTILMILVGRSSLDHVWLLGLPRCLLQFAAGMFVWRFVSSVTWHRAAGNVVVVLGLIGIGLVALGDVSELLAPWAFCLIIVGCALQAKLAERLFGNRPVVFLGEISFSIYLMHVIVLGLAKWTGDLFGMANAPPLAQAAFVGITVVIVLLVSALTWRFIELPGQALRRYVGGGKGAQTSIALGVHG